MQNVLILSSALPHPPTKVSEGFPLFSWGHPLPCTPYTSIACFLCTKQFFLWVNSFNPLTPKRQMLFLSSFRDEEMEAKVHSVSCAVKITLALSFSWNILLLTYSLSSLSPTHSWNLTKILRLISDSNLLPSDLFWSSSQVTFSDLTGSLPLVNAPELSSSLCLVPQTCQGYLWLSVTLSVFHSRSCQSTGVKSTKVHWNKLLDLA